MGRGGGQEGQEVIALDATLGGRFEEAEGDLLGARVGGGIGELLPSPANGVGEIDETVALEHARSSAWPRCAASA